MSSDAAVYFPDQLESALDTRRHPVTLTGMAGVSARDPIGNDLAEQGVRAVFEASDEQLMEQIQQGSKDALVPLFQRHARTVRNVAHRILRNEAEAEDLVQEVFLFVFRKIALFDPLQGTARSWIVQVTYHRAIDRRRYLISRRYYAPQDVDVSEEEPADQTRQMPYWGNSLEGLWGKKTAAELRSLLSADQLQTIELHFFEGYTLEEIAERIGQSLVNVRHHYYRGLEKLRKPAFARKLQPK